MPARSAGAPYCHFEHVRKLHVAHHFDRADTVDFDYRRFISRAPAPFRAAVLAAEWALIPAVELLMHARTALSPLLGGVGAARRASAAVGTLAVVSLHACLLLQGGPKALALYFLATLLFLHTLSLHDAFQHTYEVAFASDGAYVPGPGKRTAQYEEENTYSDLLSTRWPWVNLLTLNFGYHNAHHRKPMTPWYRLPALHAATYGDALADGGKGVPSVERCPQLLPVRNLAGTWFRNRLRRVLEEDYGVVAKGTGADRAAAFIGSLGVSFLTV